LTQNNSENQGVVKKFVSSIPPHYFGPLELEENRSIARFGVQTARL
jgi:hypothetical protein